MNTSVNGGAESTGGQLALVLGGGGARGAYQAGVLHGIAQLFPDLQIPIMTGISAGAINTVHLASREGSLLQSTANLIELWLSLTPEHVYDVRTLPLLRNIVRSGLRLVSGGFPRQSDAIRGMVDTEPLRQFLCRNLAQNSDGTLPGIARNIACGKLGVVALSATSYSSGESVTWAEGREVKLWQRPQRRSEAAQLSVEHVMASSALPLLFPAVPLNGRWYGDGGIRLTAPLSPALHLGATRILTISTRRPRTSGATEVPVKYDYPPPAQILGVLYNSIFLDLIDEDILRLEKVNRLLAHAPLASRDGMRVVDILVIRPSQDLRSLMTTLEPRLPPLVRYLTRGLGTRQATSQAFLSLLLFQKEYIEKLVDLGRADAERQAPKIRAFLSGEA